MKALGIVRTMAAVACLAMLPPCAVHAAEGGADEFGLWWSWAEIGGIGGAVGMGDVDGDGSPEILVTGCEGGCWVLLASGAEGYRQVATSMRTAGLPLLRLVDIPGSGRSAVLSAGAGLLTITEWMEGARTDRVLPIPPGQAMDLLLADLDGNSRLELLVIGDYGLRVLDWETGAILASRVRLSGVDIELGNIDDDGAPEIGIAAGDGSCWVIDGRSLAVDWSVPAGCGELIRFAQLTEDPTDELVSASSDGSTSAVRAWDPPGTTPLFHQAPFGTSAPRLAIGDLDPSPGDELVLGGATSDMLWILRGTDGTLVESVQRGTVESVIVGDADVDGDLEIVLVRSPYSLHPHSLSVLNGTSRVVETQVRSMWLAAHGFGAGDLDGDGDVELITGGAAELGEAPQQAGTIFGAWILSGAHGGWPAVASPRLDPDWSGHLGDFRSADIDADGKAEVCTGLGHPLVEFGCYRSTAPEPLWQQSIYGPVGPTLLTDITGDSVPEYVLPMSPDYDVVALSAFDAGDGAQLWSTRGLEGELGSVSALCFGDFAGDPAPELVAASTQFGGVVTIDPQSGEVLSSFQLGNASSFACGDSNEDGRLELYAGFATGVVAQVQFQSGSVGPPLLALDDQPVRLAVGDLLGSESTEIVVALPSALQAWRADGAAMNWSAPNWTYLARELQIVDVDGDGRNELVFLSDDQLLVFGRPYVGSVLLIDGFERGDLAEWSRAAR